jgi:hypothetical protein
MVETALEVTFNEPVIDELLSAMIPLRATNSFGICVVP